MCYSGASMRQKDVKFVGLIRRGYQIVKPSPWPIRCAAGAFFLVRGLIGWLWKDLFEGVLGGVFLLLGLRVLISGIFLWIQDMIREGTYCGKHTTLTIRGFGIGIVTFLISEVFFFVSLFWAYFHASLGALSQGQHWPHLGVWAPHPFGTPLLETAVLITSGKAVNWAKNSLLAGKLGDTALGLTCAVVLGLYFTRLQLWEYYWLSFAIWDGVYGSCFYLLTGFHGLHVIIGTIFLGVTLIRLQLRHFSVGHHFGFTAAVWYWHFVDVVWVFVYLFIICWGFWGRPS